VPSEGFECCQTNEFGDEVGLGGTARTLQSMSVVFSSWGCQSGHWNTGDCATTPGAMFPVPLTFTIYADSAGTRGAALAQLTQTVNVPFRPSASSICTGTDLGKWYNSRDKTCYNGFPQTITMTFAGGVTLPSQVFWSVAFNTTTSGYTPIGPAACNLSSGGCGYDSLNVGAFSFANAPFVGTDINEDQSSGMAPSRMAGTVSGRWAPSLPPRSSRSRKDPGAGISGSSKANRPAVSPVA
jgi:hypothetical protein